MRGPANRNLPARARLGHPGVRADLLRQARELNINLSYALEERLIERILAEGQRHWLHESEVAIEDYNCRVERDGTFSDGQRQF